VEVNHLGKINNGNVNFKKWRHNLPDSDSDSESESSDSSSDSSSVPPSSSSSSSCTGGSFTCLHLNQIMHKWYLVLTYTILLNFGAIVVLNVW
jgi:hypothetical protein